jgi:hypothetical protein
MVDIIYRASPCGNVTVLLVFDWRSVAGSKKGRKKRAEKGKKRGDAGVPIEVPGVGISGVAANQELGWAIMQLCRALTA